MFWCAFFNFFLIGKYLAIKPLEMRVVHCWIEAKWQNTKYSAKQSQPTSTCVQIVISHIMFFLIPYVCNIFILFYYYLTIEYYYLIFIFNSTAVTIVYFDITAKTESSYGNAKDGTRGIITKKICYVFIIRMYSEGKKKYFTLLLKQYTTAWTTGWLWAKSQRRYRSYLYLCGWLFHFLCQGPLGSHKECLV